MNFFIIYLVEVHCTTEKEVCDDLFQTGIIIVFSRYSAVYLWKQLFGTLAYIFRLIHFLQMFDAYGNHALNGSEVLLKVEGFSIEDQMGKKHKVMCFPKFPAVLMSKFCKW